MKSDSKEKILIGLKPPRWLKCDIYPNCKSCLNYKRACIFRYKDIDDDDRMEGLRNETCDKTLKQIRARLVRLEKKDKKKYTNIWSKVISGLEEEDFEEK